MADYVTSEELQAELVDLAQGLGLTVQELLSRYTTTEIMNGQMDAIRLDIKKITEVGELDSESMMEKIISINEQIGKATDDVVKSLFDRIADNKAALITEQTRATDAEASLLDGINKVTSATLANSDSIDKILASAKDREGVVDSQLQDLQTRTNAVENENLVTFDYKNDKGEEIEGKANALVRGEKERAIAAASAQKMIIDDNIIESSNADRLYTDELVGDIQENLDNQVESIGATIDNVKANLEESITGLESSLNSDISKNVDAISALNGDASIVGSVTQKVKGLEDKLTTNFEDVLKTAKDELISVDNNLQSQIDEITGGQSGSIQSLSDSIKVIDSKIEDVTDENGELVSKGLKSRMSDAESQIQANNAAQSQVNGSVQSQLDNLVGSGLAKNIISGKDAAQVFANVFGITLQP